MKNLSIFSTVLMAVYTIFLILADLRLFSVSAAFGHMSKSVTGWIIDGADLSVIAGTLSVSVSVLILIFAVVFLFFCIVGKLEVFIRAVEQIQSFLTLDTEYIAIMLKMVGITYIAQFSSGICKDAGYQAIAAQIEIFGKLAILVVGMPVLLALLETIQEFLL